jgi:hypothetical protein
MVEEEDKCVLCLESLKNSKVYKTLCNHSYHEDCYDQIRDERCPICRDSLDNDPRRPLRRPDSPYTDQLVQPVINPEIIEYIDSFEQTVEGDRLYDLAYDILDMNPYVTLRQLRVMILAATGREDFDVDDLLASFDSDSDFGSVYSRSSRGSVSSRNSPASSVSSRNRPASSVSSRNSPASSVSSRNSPASSVSSRNSRRSVSSRNSRGSVSSINSRRSVSSRNSPASSVSSRRSRGSVSSRSVRPPPMSSSSNSNIVTAQIETVRNPSPPVSIEVDDNGEWIKELSRIQRVGEKRGRKGGKSKRKNNKKTSRGRKTSRSR